MKKILAFEEDISIELQKKIFSLHERLLDYKQILQDNFHLVSAPKGVVYTSNEIASTVLNTVPIPAYTRNEAIVLGVDRDNWLEIFHDQCGGTSSRVTDSYYQENLESELLCILSHELTHHIELFPSSFEDYGTDIWFEEGMCFYLPRKLVLTKEAYQKIYSVELMLLNQLANQYGKSSIREFGSGSYTGELPAIMYDYWRSFVCIDYYVNIVFSGDILALFTAFQNWYKNQEQPIQDYLILDPDQVMKKILTHG